MANLYSVSRDDDWATLCYDAADEIERLAALAQSDAEPNDRVVHRDPNCEKIAAVRKAIKKAWLAHGEKTDLDADSLALAAIAATAQSDAEPVGGLAKARTIALEQRCERGTPWDLACVTIANKIGEQCGYPPIPTNTAPPRPDASAGLIEAAEIAEEWADVTSSLIEANLFGRFARYLRTRTADRSGK